MIDLFQSLLDFIHWAVALFSSLVAWLVEVVGAMGYPGVVMLMFLESSFFPFPSEVVMPPAGYLASQGEMSLVLVILCGVLGSMMGALFNYYIALRWGRRFFDRFGKYLFISSETIDRAENFFLVHGHISTFTARLIPVIRQYVSLPAGLARMNLGKFCLYTALGSGIWVLILTLTGYWIGYGTKDMYEILHRATILLVTFCVLLIGGYIVCYRRKRSKGA